MNKKYYLIIIISGVLVVGVLFWYLNYHYVKTSPVQNLEEGMETKEDKGIQSIPLEKPPFIKE